MTRARQLQAEHLAKVESATPPWKQTEPLPERGPAQSFAEQFSAHMAKLGAKGGKISGAKRMEMPEKQRKAIAAKGAAARWAKKPSGRQ